MARKIYILFILLFAILFFNNNVSYCADNLPTINIDQSEAIFDFILNISKRPTETFINNVNSSNYDYFMNFFNKKVAPQLYNNTSGECDSSKHFIVFAGTTNLFFLVTNATLSNNLGFLDIDPVFGDSYNEYDIFFEYGVSIKFNGNNNFSDSHYFSSRTYIRVPLFYDGDTPTGQAKYNSEFNTILTPNLFYLGSKALSEVRFKSFNDQNASWYFLEHYFVSDDTPSGDTPSGDIPGGDTPNYNDKLDNISGLIGDTNIKLDGISGEIGQTNNKLDGISGELGEINDNLTTVPDLSGTTINSGDIESALNFNFTEDPYSNFWLELTTGLSSALTSSNRSIDINFRNKVYTISLDDFALQVPQFLQSFLAIISTTLVIWQIVRYIKIIIDKISSGDMDTVLAMNEEERNS